MAATRRTNTPTEQNKEDNKLVLYRLELVEQAVKDVGAKLDARENLKRQDIIEFKDAIFERFAEKTADLQNQITDLEKSKASQAQLNDTLTLIKYIAGIGSTIISGLILFYITNK